MDPSRMAEFIIYFCPAGYAMVSLGMSSRLPRRRHNRYLLRRPIRPRWFVTYLHRSPASSDIVSRNCDATGLSRAQVRGPIPASADLLQLSSSSRREELASSIPGGRTRLYPAPGDGPRELTIACRSSSRETAFPAASLSCWCRAVTCSRLESERPSRFLSPTRTISADARDHTDIASLVTIWKYTLMITFK